MMLSDARWDECRVLLNPDLDPEAPAAIEYRNRAEEILSLSCRSVQLAEYKRQRRKALRGNKDNRTPYLGAALAGREFLVSLDVLGDWTGELLGLHDGVIKPSTDFGISEGARAELKRAVEIMEKLDGTLSSHYPPGEEKPHAPNAKAWLHLAVHRLYVLWEDAGQGNRLKIHFEAFAYAALRETGAVTPEAIKRSLDRRVRPRIARSNGRSSF